MVIWYVNYKTIYYHIYPRTYNISVQIILFKQVLVHIQYENYNVIILSYVLTLYVTYVIKGMKNISGYE